MPASVKPLTNINGASLLTRDGRPKSRYSLQERLELMGAVRRDLAWFIGLFCPGAPLYARTRAKSDNPRSWYTPRGRLTPDLVARHLIGNGTPGLTPTWIAPRSWEATWWLGLDVDFRGDRADFEARCNFVFHTLRAVLGVDRKGILESTTPSGGRHFRVFFTRKVRVADLANVLANVGIRECPGKIEIFPSTKKGMRLPFGLIPGETHDPTRWVRFVRAFGRGEIPRVSWLEFQDAAIRYARAHKRAIDAGHAEGPSPLPQPARREGTPTTGIPRSRRKASAPRRGMAGLSGGHAPRPGDQRSSGADGRFLELMSGPLRSVEAAAELWDLGIRSAGMRVAATKRMAFHLIVARGMREEDAAKHLVDWVYRTGSQTSVDVMADRAAGTREVENQTRSIVAWTVKQKRPKTTVRRDQACLSRSEVKAVMKVTERDGFPASHTEVALHLLRYAKLHGQATPEGWLVMVSAGRVIRRWPGCSGKGSKQVMESLRNTGLVSLAREKLQTANGTGRPRTYLVRVSPALRERARLHHEQAMAVVQSVRHSKLLERREAVLRSLTRFDTYRESKALSPSEKQSEVQGEARQRENRTRRNVWDVWPSSRKTQDQGPLARKTTSGVGSDRPGRTSQRSTPESVPTGTSQGVFVMLRRRPRSDEQRQEERGEDHECFSTAPLARIEPRHRRQAAETLGESGRRRGDLCQPPPEGSRIENEDSALPATVPRRGSGLWSWERTGDPVFDGPSRSPPLEVLKGSW